MVLKFDPFCRLADEEKKCFCTIKKSICPNDDWPRRLVYVTCGGVHMHRCPLLAQSFLFYFFSSPYIDFDPRKGSPVTRPVFDRVNPLCMIGLS